VELDHLHVDQVGTGFQPHRHAVAGALPGVGRDLIHLQDAAGRHDHGFRLEDDELAALAPVADGAADVSAVGQQLLERALHVHVDALVDGVLLEGPDHLQPGPVPDVGQAGVAVPPEIALEDQPFLGPVEERTPLLQLEDAIRRFLGVDLGHPPVVQQLAAAHRVAEVDVPAVFLPDVAQGRRDATLGHDGVGLAQQRLADQGGFRAVRRCLDRCPQAGPAGPHDDDVVLV